MIRRFSLVLAGALMSASAMSLIYSSVAPAEAASEATYKELATFGEVLERVRAQYVTPPTDDELIENAINGMLSSLDPHSSFMNGEDGLGENGMPVNGLHSAGFEKSFVSLDVVSAQIGGRLCRGVLAQISEKPEVGLEVLFDGAPRTKRAAKLRLPTKSTCKSDAEGSRMHVGEVNFNSPAVACLDVEAQAEHLIAGVHGSDAICWHKTD